MISVIIPSYNSEKTIRRCLQALVSQSYGAPYEIVLVDSSQDETPRLVAENFPQVKLIHLDHKTDPGTARNLGLKQARGEIIAFIDADCEAAPDWLERIATAHQSAYRVVGGSVRNGNDRHSAVAWAGYLAEFREFLPAGPPGEREHIPTCNISYRRQIFDDFGHFPGEFYPQEDLVFNHRLREKGERIFFDPGIVVAHHHRTRLCAFLAHQKKIGHITARVLKLLPLPGAGLVRRPSVAWLALPFLPWVKLARTVAIFLRCQPQIILRRPWVLALLAVGLMWWTKGFASGLYQSERGQSERRTESWQT